MAQPRWETPQIDNILVKKRFRSGVNIHRKRSFPGADIGSDHDRPGDDDLSSSSEEDEKAKPAKTKF